MGPDLGRHLGGHSLGYLIQSILDPDAEITEGYDSVLIITEDGQYITGIIKREDAEGIEIVNKEGEVQRIPRVKIAQNAIQKTSLMPGNYAEILTVKDLHDILAFLLSISEGHAPKHGH